MLDDRNRKRLVFVCILAIISVAGISIGFTTALFKDDVTTNVHITSGKLDIGYYATKITETKLDDDGYLVDEERDLDSTYNDYIATVNDNAAVDLKLYSDSFAFDLIYPGYTGSVEYLVVNKSRVVVSLDYKDTFAYKLSTGEVMSDAQKAMFIVTTTWEKDTTDDTKYAAIELKPNESFAFKVSFEFDEDAGDDLQESTFKIDNHITATQLNKRN